MAPDRALEIFVKVVLIAPLKVIFAIPELFIRLIGGHSTTHEDVRIREAAITEKTRKRLIHDVAEAQRQTAEQAHRESRRSRAQALGVT